MMTPEQFTYWMQGFVELNGGKQPSAEQWKSICEHINTVLHKVTPPLQKMKTNPFHIDDKSVDPSYLQPHQPFFVQTSPSPYDPLIIKC